VSRDSQLGDIASKLHEFRKAELEATTPFAVRSSAAAAAEEVDASDPVGAWIAQSDEEAELLERIRRQRVKHAAEESHDDEITQRTAAYKESMRHSQANNRGALLMAHHVNAQLSD
jgi:hypothetical protein